MLTPEARFSFPGEFWRISIESIILAENSNLLFWRVRIENASLSSPKKLKLISNPRKLGEGVIVEYYKSSPSSAPSLTV